jgi:hypothetical protein
MVVITFAFFVSEARTSLTGGVFNFDARSINVGLLVVNFLCGLLAWVFFLVFAFAEWPIQRQLRTRQARDPRCGASARGTEFRWYTGI